MAPSGLGKFVCMHPTKPNSALLKYTSYLKKANTMMPWECSSRNLQYPYRVPFIKEKMPWCPLSKTKSNHACIVIVVCNCLQLSGNLGCLVGMTLLQNCKCRGFKFRPSNVPFCHRTRERTQYTMLTHCCDATLTMLVGSQGYVY